MKLQKLARKVLHPFFVALYPVLFLYNYNKYEAPLHIVILPLTILFLSSLIFYALLSKFIKNKYKAGLIGSIAYLSFFSYGHVIYILEKYIPVITNFLTSPLFLFLWVLIFYGIARSTWKSKK